MTEQSGPQFSHSGGIYRYTWADKKLEITVDRIQQHRNSPTTAQVTCRTSSPLYRPHLHQARLNLESTQTRKQFAQYMQEKYPDADWSTVTEQLCVWVLHALREGEPAVELGEVTAQEPGYLLYPVIPLGKPAMVYADGGSGKTWFAHLCGLCVSSNFSLPTLQPTRQGNVLFLDWETERDDAEYRIAALRRGLECPTSGYFYRRCVSALADDIEAVQALVQEYYIALVVVDSVGGAVAGELTAAEEVLRFYNAYRSLRCSGLFISHVSKDEKGRAGAYGSAYWRNIVRSQWELIAQKEEGADTLAVGLFHRKVNIGKLHKPLGFQFSFNGAVSVKPVAVSEFSDLEERLPLWQRLFEELSRRPKQEVSNLTQQMQCSEALVRKELNKRKELFVRLPGSKEGIWAIREQPQNAK